MSLLLPLLFLLTAASGTAVVLIRDPARQIFAIAGNGVVLAILFTALQAPDVALANAFTRYFGIISRKLAK